MRIGIVNDMPMAAEALRRAIGLAPQHKVIWIARDGAEAVSLCASETPDLVLMDLIMPGMDGVEATRQIMDKTPCTILIVTVSIDKNVAGVFEAMGYGALDAVDTPTLGSGDPLAAAGPLLAKIDTINRLVGDQRSVGREVKPSLRTPVAKCPLIAIGASAGGPAALSVVLGALPRDLPAAVVVVQHVDARFSSNMAEWLDRHSPLPVRLAREDDHLLPGRVLLAGGDDHLVLKSADRLSYTPEPREDFYRPSVNVFFRSVARVWPGKAAGVLLTGMGADGAEGLLTLRKAGHHTIAQDQATSAVYGMPKAAAALNAAVEILPLDRIARRLTEMLAGKTALENRR